MNRPVVLVVANRDIRKNKLIDYVGEFHLDLLTQCGAFPVIVPLVRGTLPLLSQYMERMDGLLLVEGDDVEPKRYAARKANFKYVDKTLPLKDEIEIRLLRRALRREMPRIATAECGLRRNALWGCAEGERDGPRAY